MSSRPFPSGPGCRLRSAWLAVVIVAVFTPACGGTLVVPPDGSTVPSVCKAAGAALNWATCSGSVYAWAKGLGTTWQAVFDQQCSTQVANMACETEVAAYYQCLATAAPTCMPCVGGPDVGECKGTDGILWAQACSNAAFTMYECTGK